MLQIVKTNLERIWISFTVKMIFIFTVKIIFSITFNLKYQPYICNCSLDIIFDDRCCLRYLDSEHIIPIDEPEIWFKSIFRISNAPNSKTLDMLFWEHVFIFKSLCLNRWDWIEILMISKNILQKQLSKRATSMVC